MNKINLGKVVGDNGKSAYEIWLKQGNTGTEQDFLDSLKADVEIYDDTELKSKAHTHDNETVLNSITQKNVEDWNNKSEFSGDYNDLKNKPLFATETFVKNSTEKCKEELIGAFNDDVTANTINGVKNYALELVTYKDEYSENTQSGKIIAIESTNLENTNVFCTDDLVEDITTESVIATGKNLLKNVAYDKNTQGITFTKSNLGVRVSGKATANAFYYITEVLQLPAGDYHLSGSPSGGSSSTYYISIQKVENGTTSLICRDFGTGVDFNIPESATLKVFIGVVSGQEIDLNFEPMIRLKNVGTNEFEAYTEKIYSVDSEGKVVGLELINPITVLRGTSESMMLTMGVSTPKTYIDILENWMDSSFNKIENLFKQATSFPIITFIDDDTTDLEAVKLFKNTCDELGIVGGFAVVTSHLDSQPELAEALQEYEKEGFHMCLHCDVHDRFYAPATRDYAQCKSDFVTGIRKMKKYQFADPMFWCIPYGSPDEEMGKMAKKWGMECLVASGCNSYETAEAKNGRFALRRCSLDPTDDGAIITLERLKKLVRMAVAENGWLLVTTHFTEDGWVSNQDRFRELVNYAIEQGMQVKTLNEAYRIREPIYKLYETF